ncbi:MAG: DUF72 domain-containing protein [Burkholderiales bacterium]|nr:MAG: DUF72 domain-containing protein [Burkholderiales bacterium]
MSGDQFDLFGDPLPSAPAAARAVSAGRASKQREVGPAAFDDALLDVASALPDDVFLGTSSWSFSGWRGLVFDASYPETLLSRQGLGAYAAHPLFGSVGIDRTFYAPISEDEFRRYAKQAATADDAFKFLVKAPMLFTGPRLRSEDGVWTDNDAFLDSSLATTQFVLPATRGLAEHCGPLVFQFPPLGPRYTRAPAKFADRLAEFLLALPKLALPACYAVEVRDPELLCDEYTAALNAANATHCIAIHARMPQAREQAHYWRESSRILPLVIRWSLHSGFKYEEAKERYAPFDAIVDPDENGLAQVGALIEEAHATSRASFAIVNNKAEGSAPLTVRRIATLLAKSGSEASGNDG